MKESPRKNKTENTRSPKQRYQKPALKRLGNLRQITAFY